MSNKFDLASANWLSYVIDPTTSISKLRTETIVDEKKVLKFFIDQMRHTDFLLSHQSQDLKTDTDKLEKLSLYLELLSGDSLPSINFYLKLREYLSIKQWIALIIPSGLDATIDSVLCDKELLGYLVQATSNNQGLILQLEESPSDFSTLLNIYPAIRTALNETIDWPGVLLWFPGNDSVFLPVGSLNFLEIDIEARVQWIFSKLSTDLANNLGHLKIEYQNAFPEVFEHQNKTINILHLSDLHLGSQVASQRISRLREYIRLLIEELGEKNKIIPVITGDLMDNPSEKHISQVCEFWNFLSNLGTEEPLLVLGNNDVRQDGNINENYRTSVGFPITKVIWYDNEKLALICINSVMHGKLEYGSIDHQQLTEIAYEIERKEDFSEFKFVMLLHHHPIVHKIQKYPSPLFYEQTIGGTPLDITEAIENSDLLLDFAKKYDITAILHGHRHIPLMSKTDKNIPVVCCGSSIGKISEFDNGVYFSANILSINQATQKVTIRLLSYRKPGRGQAELKWHENIFRA